MLEQIKSLFRLIFLGAIIIFCLLFCLSFFGYHRQTWVILDEETGHELTYQCLWPIYKVETQNDIQALTKAYFGTVLPDANKRGLVVSFEPLKKAFEDQNYKEFEKLLVSYLCKYNPKRSK